MSRTLMKGWRSGALDTGVLRLPQEGRARVGQPPRGDERGRQREDDGDWKRGERRDRGEVDGNHGPSVEEQSGEQPQALAEQTPDQAGPEHGTGELQDEGSPEHPALAPDGDL